MHYVILRDDDANALTPPGMLERLYRPFLDDGMPVHLSAIPEVRTDTRAPSGDIEGYLLGPQRGAPGYRPLSDNSELLDYLRHEPGYHVLQHGLHHEFVDGHSEFESDDRADVVRRLERGSELLRDAGFERPMTFVAPQDKLSRTALREVSQRFPVISTGWFSMSSVPHAWWPAYLFAKKVAKRAHWKMGGNTYLTHPGCILSYNRDPESILPELQRQVSSRKVTVIVSHHWEYFAGGEENRPYIAALEGLHAWLRDRQDVKVVRFDQASALV